MIDHLDDLESDFSAIHGLDMWALDGPRLLRLAWRMPAYDGVMRMRLLEQEREREGAKVDGVDELLDEVDDVATQHTVRHALSLIPDGAEVSVVADEDLVV